MDELYSTSSFDGSSHCCGNRSSTEEWPKLHQFNLKIYIGVSTEYALESDTGEEEEAAASTDASELRLQEVTKRVGHFCPSPSGC